jgi:hypothetical protein
LVFFKDEATKKVGFKDQEGNIVVQPKFLVVHSFENGFAPVKMETGYGFINEKGEDAVPCIYDRVFPFSDGLAPVMKKINGEALFGFVDTKGKVIIPLRYQYASIFSEGLASVFINNRNEYIDKTGKIIFKLPEGHKGSYFKDGKAQVNDGNDVIYLINKKGARTE